jgi:bisphosphoglycerate-independent phosphoglycerate mutase (AlkP superfamily)
MNPSVTFPCHFSMTHSVAPNRHGILTNTYVPQVRPIAGIFEKINNAGGVSAMFYGWEPLRDIASPGSLKFSTYVNAYTRESADTVLTDKCLELLETDQPDFVFLYMVDTDEKGGHDAGWMSETYLDYISCAINNVKKVIETVGDEYHVIVTADHGGHDRCHGTDMPEDTTIPMIFHGTSFKAGEEFSGVSILDIAPTIVKIMGVSPEREWEGSSVI